MQYEFPAASKEKIDAIVYKRMYNTIRDEINIHTGKKSPEKKTKDQEVKPYMTEQEIIKQLETMLEEEKKKIEIEKQMRKEEKLLIKNKIDKKINTTQNSVSLPKITKKTEENNSSRSKYPIDAEEYKKILKERELEEEEKDDDIIKEKMQKKESDDSGDDYYVDPLQRLTVTVKNKNKIKKHPFVKYEYYHKGTYVIYIIINLD